MKKRIAILTAVLGMFSLVSSSYNLGASLNGQVCCGAKGNVTTCAGASGTGCHGAGTGTDCYISVRNALGDVVGDYIPGNTYTVIIGGTNHLALPKFGFQFTTVKGSGTDESIAGSYTGFPLYVTSNIYSGLRFVEQTQGINAPVAGVYQETFQWIAPTIAGSGIVKMYLTLLAVNGNNFQDAGDVSANVSITLLEKLGTSVANTPDGKLEFKAYPNPLGNKLNLQIAEHSAGLYTVFVYDLSGRQIAMQQAEAGNMPEIMSLNTSNWQPGMYNVVLLKDGATARQTVIKE